jgi:putative ABC transport system permease protein
VERQSDYWKRIFDSFPLNAVAIAYILGALIAIGTVAGTAQTMYSAVIARQEEIAILRAIGFGGFAVAASVMLEAMLLASAGALIGTATDRYLLDGLATNGASGAFRAAVTPHLLFIAIVWALTIAFVGALSPAIKASRVTVVEALRAH